MGASFEIIGRGALGRETWDAFVEGCAEAWLWHTFDLQDALCTWPTREDASFAVIDKNDGGRVCAVVPLHRMPSRRRGASRALHLDVLDSMGGPACADRLGDKHRRGVIDFIRGEVVALAGGSFAREARFALSPMSPALRGEACPRVNPLLSMGCANTLTQTWVVDLRGGEDVVWKNMEGRARTAVRAAESGGISVRAADRQGDVDVYYAMHCDTYNRTGVPPHPKEYFESIWRDFAARGLAFVLFAEKDGAVIAAESFALYKDASVYWTGAALTEGLQGGANSLLQWTAMKRMIGAGALWYETGEAFPHERSGKSRGLSDFKKSFGGEMYPYYRGVIETAGGARRIFHKLRGALGGG